MSSGSALGESFGACIYPYLGLRFRGVFKFLMFRDAAAADAAAADADADAGAKC